MGECSTLAAIGFAACVLGIVLSVAGIVWFISFLQRLSTDVELLGKFRKSDNDYAYRLYRICSDDIEDVRNELDAQKKGKKKQ